MSMMIEPGGGTPGRPGSGVGTRPPRPRPPRPPAAPTMHPDTPDSPHWRPGMNVDLGPGSYPNAPGYRDIAWDDMFAWQRRENLQATRDALMDWGMDPIWADHDEFGPIFQQAIWEGWSGERIDQALMRSDAFRNMVGGGRGGGRRGGGGRSAQDIQRDIENLLAEIRDRAAQLGLRLTDDQLVEIATTAVNGEWNGARIVDALLETIDFDDLDKGDLTALRDSMREQSASYLLPMSEDTARDLAARMARGELTREGVTSMLAQQARARFSWMSELIDQGITPSEYFAPTKEMLARTLEMNPNDIDLMDGRWLNILEVTDDNGRTRGATLHEAMMAAREQPEWVNTRNAQQTAMGAANAVAAAFGRR